VTTDPHAYNALKHDYRDVAPVEHISQTMARHITSGTLRLKPVEGARVYTYHDPCYLGRTTRCTTRLARCWMRFPD
jgi:Fe-S oxidoreductase